MWMMDDYYFAAMNFMEMILDTSSLHSRLIWCRCFCTTDALHTKIRKDCSVQVCVCMCVCVYACGLASDVYTYVCDVYTHVYMIRYMHM